MRIGFAAPLALLVLGAAPLPQEKTGEICGVRYSRVLAGTYEQTTAKRMLPGLMIEGSASPGEQAFNFFDDDGSLTLAMLLAAWQADGTTAANQNGDVTIDRRDAVLMEHAGRVGSAYFGAILDYAAGVGNITPQQIIEVAQARTQLALFQRVEAQAKASLAVADGKFILPRRFITEVGGYFETLRPTAKDAVNSRYRDMATGRASRLCDPGADSTLLGQMLCDRNLGTGAPGKTSYCRSSTGITSPARAMMCEVHPIDGKPTLGNCTDGAGGASIPAPPTGD